MILSYVEIHLDNTDIIQRGNFIGGTNQRTNADPANTKTTIKWRFDLQVIQLRIGNRYLRFKGFYQGLLLIQ